MAINIEKSGSMTQLHQTVTHRECISSTIYPFYSDGYWHHILRFYCRGPLTSTHIIRKGEFYTSYFIYTRFSTDPLPGIFSIRHNFPLKS